MENYDTGSKVALVVPMMNPITLEIDSDDPVPFSEMDGGQKFAYWSYVVCAILCALTFVCLLYVTVRVIKLVGANERIIPAMLICLQLSILGSLIFFIVQCYNKHRRISYKSQSSMYC